MNVYMPRLQVSISKKTLPLANLPFAFHCYSRQMKNIVSKKIIESNKIKARGYKVRITDVEIFLKKSKECF